MAEFIDRQAAIEAVCGCIPHSCDIGFCGFACSEANALSKLPAADVLPVVRGKWTLNKDGSGTCSECGRTQKNCWDLDNWDNFCHFCGADMRTTT